MSQSPEPPDVTHRPIDLTKDDPERAERRKRWWRRRLDDASDCDLSCCSLSDVIPDGGGSHASGWDGTGCDAPDCGGCDGCDPGCSLLMLANLLVVLRAVPREPGSPHGTAGWLWRRVRAYQIHISAHRPPVCPMTPTCSRYGLDALSRHGAIRGSWLTWRRIRRCRRPGAYDPVPEPGR